MSGGGSSAGKGGGASAGSMRATPAPGQQNSLTGKPASPAGAGKGGAGGSAGKGGAGGPAAAGPAAAGPAAAGPAAATTPAVAGPAAATTPAVAGGQPNVYNQSSGALGTAGNLYTQAAGMYGQPGLTGRASTAANPADISSGINQYMNPYTNQVINRATNNVQRLTNMQQNQNAAAAGNAGAFGGSRHGLVEATTNSEAQRNIGDLSANLRNQGFNTAAQLSGQDIANQMGTNQFNAGQTQNWRLARSADQLARAGGLMGAGGAQQGLGGDYFNVGNTLNQQQMGAGSLQQQLIQSLMTGAQGQYGQFMNQPQNMLNTMIQSLGMNPLASATTTTGSYTPGLFDYLSLAGQTAGNALSGGWGGGGT